MQHNMLRRLNFFIYIAIALIAVVVQSTLFSYSVLRFIQPDFVFIITIYLGLRRGPIEGSILVGIISFIVEAHTGAGKEYFLTIYLYAFLAAKIFTTVMVVPNVLASVGLVACLTFFKKVAILILLGFVGKATNGMSHFLIFTIPAILVHAILSPFCFALFSKIDFLTDKIELAPGELDSV